MVLRPQGMTTFLKTYTISLGMMLIPKFNIFMQKNAHLLMQICIQEELYGQ